MSSPSSTGAPPGKGRPQGQTAVYTQLLLNREIGFILGTWSAKVAKAIRLFDELFRQCLDPVAADVSQESSGKA